MKYCTHCGSEITDDAVVCQNCGYPVGRKIVRVSSTEKLNGFALAGFICSFFSPILGWIFGGIAFSRFRYRPGKNKKFAVAALIISSVSFVLDIILGILYFKYVLPYIEDIIIQINM